MEKPLDILAMMTRGPEQQRGSPYPHYHRGSLVVALKLMQHTVDTDWSQFFQILIGLVSQDGCVGNRALEEFRLHLHLHGLHGMSSHSQDIGPAFGTGGLDTTVVVTLVVPRDALRKLYTTESMKLNAAPLQLVVSSGIGSESFRVFHALQLSFGQVERHGSTTNDDFSISVAEDKLGWGGESSLIVSCYVPRSVLKLGPKAVGVSLGVQPTAHSYMALKIANFGPEMIVFGTMATEKSSVFVTNNMPGTSGETIIFQKFVHLESAREDSPSSWFSANVDTASSKIVSFTGHIDVTTDKGKKLLDNKAAIKLQQSSPFVIDIDIVFGKDVLVLLLHFPIPVLERGSQTRVARKSSYIEVIASVAAPLDAEPLADFIYPVVRGPKSVLMMLNGHHLTLDSLPILDVEAKNKSRLEFMTMLTGLQFSTREKLARQTGRNGFGITANQRLNFKESIFTMFMLSAGLQGDQTGLFLLQHADLGGVLYVIVRSVRLDGAAGSVVLDAAIFPLTMERVMSDELHDFFLLVRDLETCAINVNDEELRLWRRLIPAFVERCRTWSHKKSCEYKRLGATIRLSQKTGEQFLCSCGNGKLPENYSTIPDWDVAQKYAVRAAISPTFSVPFVEDIIDMSTMSLGHKMENLTTVEKCHGCGNNEGASGNKLLKCARCKEVSYCSKECQKADWKKHRAQYTP